MKSEKFYSMRQSKHLACALLFGLIVLGCGEKNTPVFNPHTPNTKPAATASSTPQLATELERYSSELIAQSYDGSRFVTFKWNPNARQDNVVENTIKVWNSKTGKELVTLPDAHHATCLAMSPDGRYAASGSGFDDELKFWEVATGTLRQSYSLHGRFGYKAIDFTADGKTIICATGLSAAIVDVATGSLRQEPLDKALATGVSCSPIDPKVFAIAGYGTQNLVQVRHLDTLEVLHALEATSNPLLVKFSRDGNTLASATAGGPVAVWNTADWTPKAVLNQKGTQLQWLAVSPDGTSVAGSQLISGHPQVELWTVATGQSSVVARGSEALFTPDGALAVVHVAGPLRLFDPKTAAPLSLASLATRPALLPSTGIRPGATSSKTSLDKVSEPTTTVAVLDFENRGASVDFGRLGAAISQMVIGDLSRYESLRVVERSAAAPLLHEGALAQGGLTNRGSGTSADRVAADFMVAGSFVATGDTISLNANLLKVGQDKPVAEWQFSGTVRGVAELESQLANRIIGSLQLHQAAQRKTPRPQDGPSPVVAVLNMKNLGASAKLDAMEPGFAEILQANLSAIKNVRLVERGKIDRIFEEQRLTLSGSVDSQSAIAVGRLLGADRLLYGSFWDLGGELSLQLRLVDSRTGDVVGSERGVSKLDEFGETMDELTLRIVSDLAVRPPEEGRQLLAAARPVRKLEAAIHYAQAKQLLRQGKAADAAQRFEQAILVEPTNVYLHHGRIQARSIQGDAAGVIEAAGQALSQPFNAAQDSLKLQIYRWLLQAYAETRQQQLFAELNEKMNNEFAATLSQSEQRLVQALKLAAQNRRDEAVALIEGAAEQVSWRSQPFMDVYRYYLNEPTKSGQIDERQRKESASKAVAIYERILQEARGSRDGIARSWGMVLVPYAPQVQWKDEHGHDQMLLSTEQQEDTLSRGLNVFDWIPDVALAGYIELAKIREEREKWPDAVDAYHRFLSVAAPDESDQIPCNYDWQYLLPSSWLDRRIEARYRVARILHERLRDETRAREKYQELIREAGVAHSRGPSTIADLAELGVSPEYPEKTVLLWGGGGDAYRAWSNLLTPRGFVVHSLRLERVTPAHLAPYTVVVLIRSGNIPYTPSDVLALRSYVATGGSLLVVVSPGWEPAAPSIHNALLSFFGVRAGDEAIVRAQSVRLNRHFITNDIAQAMAKNAVGLQVPTDAALMQADGRTVLAALPYRMGRVVVASFGQWYLPDPSVLGEPWWKRRSSVHWSRTVATGDLPIEVGSGLERPLLERVIAWLSDPPQRDDTFIQQRRQLLDAYRRALEVQSHAVAWSELRPAMEQLAAHASTGIWKEEMLWAAAESYQQMCYRSERQFMYVPSYGYASEESLDTDPQYYLQLVEQFPTSPLRPYAEWRLGECARREEISKAFRATGWAQESDSAAAIEPFRAVKAAQGSYAWAWAQLRLGVTYLRNRNIQQAAAQFHQVSEAMPAGPEKSMALLNLAACYEGLKQPAEARRSYEAVSSLPDIYWWYGDVYSAWAPISLDGSMQPGPSRFVVKRGMDRLRAQPQ